MTERQIDIIVRYTIIFWMCSAVPASGAFGEDYYQMFKDRRAAHSAKTFKEHMYSYNKNIKRLTKNTESVIIPTKVKTGVARKIPKYCPIEVRTK